VTIELGEDELLGAHLVARMDGVESRDGAGLDEVLRSSLRHGVVDRLAAAGIAWPPTADALELADRVGGEVATDGSRDGERRSLGATAGPDSAGTGWARRRSAGLRRTVLLGAALAVAVVLVGGYALRWSWTGFTANKQLWDWMQLLLLPVALATFPLWLRFSPYISRGRRRTLGTALVVFAVFVLVAYVNPLTWTGFRGQTLWSWLTLIILPVSIVTVRIWPESGRGLHRRHVVAVTLLCAALVTTIVGGYWAGWSWTGYEGNTLWDWLTLVLAPAAVTTILVPTLARLLTGAADERAERDRERAARELAANAARERLAHR
jgi:cation transport ATPase